MHLHTSQPHGKCSALTEEDCGGEQGVLDVQAVLLCLPLMYLCSLPVSCGRFLLPCGSAHCVEIT